jgi:dolichol-phosphate mannosyltransferase
MISSSIASGSSDRPEPSSEPSAKSMPIELAVVIPTYKERENVPHLLAKLRNTLIGIRWEAIFVDDHSPDGTADAIRAIALTDPQVRVIERVGRRGLSSACIEGMMSTAAPYIAVMDADLQHDETILPEMFRKISSEHLDVVVASRNMAGGSLGEFAADRARLSKLGARISRFVCKCDVTDPMSGFFILEAGFARETVDRLTGTGFKILVDLLASTQRNVKLGEVPYRFRNRQHGESKLDLNVELEYLYLLVDKMIGRWVPTRFVLFVMVGFLGVGVHLSVLAGAYVWGHYAFSRSQAVATLTAMVFNFLLNNMVTFRDRKLRGVRLVFGLITFCLACSVGALLNVSFASFLLLKGIPWVMAGILGMAISSVWNFGVNTVITWRRSRIPARQAAPSVAA